MRAMGHGIRRSCRHRHSALGNIEYMLQMSMPYEVVSRIPHLLGANRSKKSRKIEKIQQRFLPYLENVDAYNLV